jgi:hypothetical protein
MDEHEVVWPMGLSDQDPSLADRPLAFNPKGFLVAILEDDDHAEQARAALMKAGFADRDLRVYTSQQILDDHQRYLAQRSLARQVVTAVTVDPDSLKRYLDPPARAAPPCGSMSPTTPTSNGPCACWPTTRFFTCATTARNARKTSTSADQPAHAGGPSEVLPLCSAPTGRSRP